jgi:hypothetical protein
MRHGDLHLSCPERGSAMLASMKIPALPVTLASVLCLAVTPGWSDVSTEQRAFAERYAVAWCSGVPDLVAAFFADEGSLTINEGEPAVGREAIAAAAKGFMDAFPDLVVIFDRLEERDGRLLFHWTLEGTNTKR